MTRYDVVRLEVAETDDAESRLFMLREFRLQPALLRLESC
jgi:hypothetical protein